MPLRTSIWVHGTIVQVENPDALANTVRKGRGTAFTGKSASFNWFHFPVPTPSVLDNIRPLLAKVFVYYDSIQGLSPTIEKIHLWDGGQQIKTFEQLNLTGSHGNQQDAMNTFAVDPPVKIIHGLVICVGVRFPVKKIPPDFIPDLTDLNILFTAAGADFQKP